MSSIVRVILSATIGLAACWAHTEVHEEGGDADLPGSELTAAECSDGVDNDADRLIDCADPGCADHCSGCIDLDGDGFSTDPSCGALDCDDSRADISPGTAPSCGEALDHDCDGVVDELSGCTGGAFNAGVSEVRELFSGGLAFEGRSFQLEGTIFVSGSTLYAPASAEYTTEGRPLVLLEVDVSDPARPLVLSVAELGEWGWSTSFHHTFKWGDRVYLTAHGDAFEGAVVVVEAGRDGLGAIEVVELGEYLWSTTASWGSAYVSGDSTGLVVLDREASVVDLFPLFRPVMALRRGDRLLVTSLGGSPSFGVYEAASGRLLGGLSDGSALYDFSTQGGAVYAVGYPADWAMGPTLFALRVGEGDEVTLGGLVGVESDQVWSVFAFDRVVVVTDDRGFTLFSLEDPLAPSPTIRVSFPTQALDSFVSGRRLYVAGSGQGLQAGLSIYELVP